MTEQERIEAWMEAHRINGVRARIKRQLDDAAKRGSKRTPVALGDLSELLAQLDAHKSKIAS